MTRNTIAAIILLTIVSLGMLSCEISVWQECRDAGHSWYYCMRVLSR